MLQLFQYLSLSNRAEDPTLPSLTLQEGSKRSSLTGSALSRGFCLCFMGIELDILGSLPVLPIPSPPRWLSAKAGRAEGIGSQASASLPFIMLSL